jgi:hypothetical protein
LVIIGDMGINLVAFARDNGFVMGSNVIEACNYASVEMQESRDPLHNFGHVVALMKDLQQFINEDKTMKWDKIDMEAVVLAIYWHDVWKSKRFSKSIKTMVAHNMYEGIGSMRIFGRYAKQFQLDKELTKKVRYAIRKHSALQFLPKKSVESKILIDLDNLQQWSVERLKIMIELFGGIGAINPRLFKMADLYFRRWTLRITEKKYYFEWSKKQMRKRKIVFFMQVKKLLLEHAGNIWRNYKSSRMVAESG